MTEEDLLNHLPDAGYPATTRPMPAIVTRAHEIRRGRRLFATGAGLGAAALVTAFSVATGGLSLPGDGAAGINAAAQGSAQNGGVKVNDPAPDGTSIQCNTGFARAKKLSDLPALVYLPSEAAAGPMTGPVMPRLDTSACAFKPPQAVAYSTSNGVSGTVNRRLQIGAPDARNEYGDLVQNGASFDGDVTQVPIDGVQADVYGLDGQSWLYMFWTAPDGTSRELRSEGITRAELATVAAGLTFGDDGELDTGERPDGFTAWADLPDTTLDATSAKVVRSVGEQFHGDDEAAGWQFEVYDRATFGDAPIGGKQVTIGLSTGPVKGWWAPMGNAGGNKGQGLLVWRTDDLEFRVGGNDAPLSLAQALRIADSVQKADPSDPRFVAAGEI